MFVRIAGGLTRFILEVLDILLNRFSDIKSDFPLPGPCLLSFSAINDKSYASY